MNITFFCRVNKTALSVVEFYKQDIEILKELGYSVSIATKWSEINYRKSDLIFIWWWTYAIIPVLIAKIFRKKTTITGTFNYRCPYAENDYFRRSWIQRLAIKMSTKMTDANILVSKYEYQSISDEWSLKNLYYSPHCIDIEKYQYNSTRRKNLLFLMCWTEAPNLRRKCLPEVIDAIQILKNKSISVQLIIAGRKGNGYQMIRELIKERELGDFISLIGEISERDKIKWMQECTIYLQPSKYEGFGLAMAEAMSCGAPVITTDAGEVRQVVEDAGVILSDCEPKELADAIDNLLQKPNYREDIGKKARNKIEKDFPKSRRRNELKNIIGRYQK